MAVEVKGGKKIAFRAPIGITEQMIEKNKYILYKGDLWAEIRIHPISGGGIEVEFMKGEFSRDAMADFIAHIINKIVCRYNK